MLSTQITARVNTSDHRLLQPFTGTATVVNGLTDINNAFVKCLFILNWS